MRGRLLERLLDATRFDPTAHVPLHWHDSRIGWLQPAFADALQIHPEAFSRDTFGVRLASTAQLDNVVLALAADGWIRGWRDERYEVRPSTGRAFTIERAAFRRFGMLATASHLNGYVNTGGNWKLWVARRSDSKPVDPGMLDNLVGGGVAAGSSPAATLVKESGEEAGIAPDLAGGAQAAGCLRTTRAVADGVHDEIIHVYDLELPPGFVPSNRDGEVAEFKLMEPAELVPRVASGEFTVDAGAVIVDFLWRRRWLEDAEIGAALKALRADQR